MSTLTAEPETLVAGRELDALIAEKVMGWRNLHVERHGDDYPRFGQPPGVALDCVNVPRFSTDIADAWKVVEALDTDFLTLEYLTGVDPDAPSRRNWQAEFRLSRTYAWADTAPLAICLAALKAVGKT